MLSSSPLYVQDLSSLPPLPQFSGTLQHLQELSASLPLFQHLQNDALLDDLEPIAKKFQSFDDILVLGTGGSSLGGQALLELRDPKHKVPRFHFLDNIDPHTFAHLFATLSFDKTGIIAISKSGNTAETLMQLLLCLQKTKENFLIISEPGNNGIRRLAKAYDIPCLDHPNDIGGRFAVFTVVGMLPALIAGLDAKALREGARQVLSETMNTQDSPPLQGALAHHALMKKGVTQTVLMPYIDRLKIFTLWFRQLWAESLGKRGSPSITPIQALGTVDQHSQLQLYLDGPKDKFFTVVTLDHAYDSLKANFSPVGHDAVDLFQGKTIGNLMEAEQQATIDTLRNHHCPTRAIKLENLNERTLGGLMMHFILETLAMAHLLDVNPFDQPAVEEGKILTRKYLSEMP